MLNKELIRIGSDFEMFLMDNTGKFISAIPFNRGTKTNPEPLEKEGCAIQRDGVLQEANVPPVKLNEADLFWENVQYVKSYIRELVKPHGLQIKCCSSAVLTDDQFSDFESTQLGCDASYDGWRYAEVNEKPNPENPRMRTTGGHIHMSYNDPTFDKTLDLVRLFDLFVTLPMVLTDTDKDRRKIYGKAGEFRFQQWGEIQGVEFRTLSGIWLDSKEYVDFIFNQLNTMIDFYNENELGNILDDKDDIIKAINEGDENLAEKLCDKYNIKTLCKILI